MLTSLPISLPVSLCLYLSLLCIHIYIHTRQFCKTSEFISLCFTHAPKTPFVLIRDQSLKEVADLRSEFGQKISQLESANATLARANVALEKETREAR